MNICGRGAPEYALEFLLAFDGYRHHYPEGYYTKFEIKRTKVTPETSWPALLLHAAWAGWNATHRIRQCPRGRAAGFEIQEARGCRRSLASHWERSRQALSLRKREKLVDDFFDEIERVLTERGIPLVVVADEKVP
jgi:hypothetical protein